MRPADKIAEVVRQLTYKPGWTIEVNQPLGDEREFGVFVAIMCRNVDANDHTQVSGTASILVIPLHLAESPERVVQMVEARVRELEAHEFKEFFRLGGRPVHAPHNPDGTFA